MTAGCAAPLLAAEWVRPDPNSTNLVWGAPSGLRFAIPPGGFRSPEPRGLIRLGYPIGPEGRYELVNFIAIEPVVRGRKGFSELEFSQLDQARGKRLSVIGPVSGNVSSAPGPASGAEQLTVALAVEKFENGAQVRITLSQRSDAPDELRLAVATEAGSAPLEYCILTATMGNMARARDLWLKDRKVSSLALYANYKDVHFAEHTFFPLNQLLRAPQGEVLAAITNDEENPASVTPFPHAPFWTYGGEKVTQYWKKPAGAIASDLAVAVNARHTYWQSQRPIPGGIAYENFEMRERFHEGQQFIFGITRKTPQQLGFKQQR